MKELLNNNDFCRAAKKLKCEVAAIKAVAKIESAGKGFYSDDFPVILFERHLFKKFTNGKYNKTHPHLSGPAGNYGAAGKNQIKKFNEAFALDPIAAMKACSWGKFQILGSNHAVCGFSSVGKFVDAMKESEGKHLDAFVNFVIGNGLDKHLRSLNWASFARGYNGSAYKKHNYDGKLAEAYKKFAKENINCGNLPEVTNPTPTEETNKSITVENAESVKINEAGSNEGGDNVKISVEDGNVKVETNAAPEVKEKLAVVGQKPVGVFKRLYTKVAAAVTGSPLVIWLTDQSSKLAGIALSPALWQGIIIAVIVVAVSWIIYEMVKAHQEKKRQKELDTLLVEQNSTPNNLVQIVDPEDAALFAAKGWKIINRGDPVVDKTGLKSSSKKEDE